ncbi:hypothetical protein BGX24_004738 [Mortierella sp. AD032]|nr:hypothetical protein BGX24_004738 [Mortierella sp. AD032]
MPPTKKHKNTKNNKKNDKKKRNSNSNNVNNNSSNNNDASKNGMQQSGEVYQLEKAVNSSTPNMQEASQQQQQQQKQQDQINNDIVSNCNPNRISKNTWVNKNINTSYVNIVKYKNYNNNLGRVKPPSSPLSSSIDAVPGSGMDSATILALKAERAKYEDDNIVDCGTGENDSGFASDDPSWNERPIENSFAIDPYGGCYKSFSSCGLRKQRIQNHKNYKYYNSKNQVYPSKQRKRNNSAFVAYTRDPSSVPIGDRYSGGRPDDPIYQANGAPIAPPPEGPGSLVHLKGACVDPSNLNHWIDDHTMVLRDGAPKAFLHFLILPTEQKYVTMNNLLRGDGVEVVKRLVARAEILIARESKRHSFLKFIMGFHVAPSMKIIHLHVISIDFDSYHMDNLSRFNSFTSEFFWPPEQVIRWIEDKKNRVVPDFKFLSRAEKAHYQSLKHNTIPRCSECPSPTRTVDMNTNSIDKQGVFQASMKHCRIHHLERLRIAFPSKSSYDLRRYWESLKKPSDDDGRDNDPDLYDL